MQKNINLENISELQYFLKDRKKPQLFKKKC